MDYIRMVKGYAEIPPSFWERILVTEKEYDTYLKQGFTLSGNALYDNFDLQPGDTIICITNSPRKFRKLLDKVVPKSPA